MPTHRYLKMLMTVLMFMGSLDLTGSFVQATALTPEQRFLRMNGLMKLQWFDSMVSSLTHKNAVSLPSYMGPGTHGLIAWDTLSKNRLWIVGRLQTPLPQLTVLSTKDGGSKWMIRQIPRNEGADLINTIDFVDPRYGWILTTSSPALGLMQKNVYRTVDGGLHWSLVGSNTQGTPKLHGLAFAFYPTGMLFRTKEQGWITIDSHGTPGATIVLRTTDGGETWVAQALSIPAADRSISFTAHPPTFFGVHHHEGQLILTSISKTVIYTTTNGGQTWQVASKR